MKRKSRRHPFDVVASFFYNAALPSWYFTTTCTDQCGSRVACKQPGGGGVWVTPFHVSLSVWLLSWGSQPLLCRTLYEPWHWNASIVYTRSLSRNNEPLRVYIPCLVNLVYLNLQTNAIPHDAFLVKTKNLFSALNDRRRLFSRFSMLMIPFHVSCIINISSLG